MKILIIILVLMLVSCSKDPDVPPVDNTPKCSYAEYYRQRPDVVKAGMDALEHYRKHGKAEGMCQPCKDCDTPPVGNEKVITFEAEAYGTGVGVDKVNVGDASGGVAIQFTSTPNGRVDYEINVKKTGTYLVAIRTKASDSENNGIFISYDGDIQRAPNGHIYSGVADIFLKKGGTWFEELQWQGPGHGDVKGPVTVYMHAGKRTFTIWKRKHERPLIDKVTLTLQ